MIKPENHQETLTEYWIGIPLRWSSGYLRCFLLGKEDKAHCFLLLIV